MTTNNITDNEAFDKVFDNYANDKPNNIFNLRDEFRVFWQAAKQESAREIEHWKMIAADQKILIEGLKGECKEMGTTDICVALGRKDTQITELQAQVNRLLNTLKPYAEYDLLKLGVPKPGNEAARMLTSTPCTISI